MEVSLPSYITAGGRELEDIISVSTIFVCIPLQASSTEDYRVIDA